MDVSGPVEGGRAFGETEEGGGRYTGRIERVGIFRGAGTCCTADDTAL